MIQEIANRIKAKEKEKNILLNELKLWAQAKAQGIDIDNVLVFGFDPTLVPQSELNRIKLAKPVFNKSNPYGWEAKEVNGVLTTTPELYNYVRMKTGEKIPLTTPIRNPKFMV